MIWTVVFFIAAQLSGTVAALGMVQALALRRSTMSPAELAVLGRPNLTALVAAGVTMFAAGAAVPGQASAAALLAGPSLAVAALVSVIQVRRHTRRLDGARTRTSRSPMSDLAQLSRINLPNPSAPRLLAVIVIVAATAAFLRDTAEQATAGGAAVTAGVEAFAVVACFTLFGRTLGLWTRR